MTQKNFGNSPFWKVMYGFGKLEDYCFGVILRYLHYATSFRKCSPKYTDLDALFRARVAAEDAFDQLQAYVAFEVEEGRVESEPADAKNIDHPAHYTTTKLETIDAIEMLDWGLDAEAKDVVKYLTRWRYKGQALQDVAKARWYFDRFVGLFNDGRSNEEVVK